MIEKRRRDRINNSLHELKRLVPAAFEKQGSAKLEKAEILQLTVDHLRVLHSKGKHRRQKKRMILFLWVATTVIMTRQTLILLS